MVSAVRIMLQLPITCLGERECEIYGEIYGAMGEWSFDLGCGFFTKYCFNTTPMSPHSLSALLDFILFWRPGAAGVSLFCIQCDWKSWRQWDDTFKRSHWIMHALFPVNPTCGGRPSESRVGTLDWNVVQSGHLARAYHASRLMAAGWMVLI